MQEIRIGIFGLRRGSTFIDSIKACGGKIVAVCEKDEKQIEDVKKSLPKDVCVYSDFDSFVEHPMDAVLLANFFHEHAPFAIRCLEKGIHVLSECTAGSTLAECVALARAARKSNAVYMLAENYPFMIFNQEMKRVCDEGSLGKIYYAEGEYNHPMDWYDTPAVLSIRPYEKHWRNFLPRSYYITHSLAPIMYATGAFPARVTAMAINHPLPADCPTAGHVSDVAAIITTQNTDGSVFKVTGCSAFGAHGNSYRICGEKGQIENLRGMGDKVMLRYNHWNIPEGKKEVNCYKPKWKTEDRKSARAAGHGGGDYFIIRHFFECLREGKQPVFDYRFATALSAVAILAHRSILNGAQPFDIPDFGKEEDCTKYENDILSPFYYSDGTAPSAPCCSDVNYAPTAEQLNAYLASKV
ncbi:MAG: Gfo/Idh/MocA family oxidoreductase [Clostridia bacterium]|nr:Gfo/Idh/MocA family oxidoreductase [Clostridia bacterium]